jgi:hypothetical protein
LPSLKEKDVKFLNKQDMLNLKELEKKLDIALANETTESLSFWLEEKRLRGFLSALGMGQFTSLAKENNVIPQAFSFGFNVPVVTVDIDYSYPLAA